MLCATLDLYKGIKLKWLFTGMEIAIGPVYKSMSVETKTASLCLNSLTGGLYMIF